MLPKDQLLLEFRLDNQARGLSPRTITYYDDNLLGYYIRWRGLLILFREETLKIRTCRGYAL